MSEESKEIAVQEQKSSLATQEKSGPVVPSFDLSTGEELPDLYTEGRVVPADLGSEYWTPETEGEFKLGFIQQIEKCDYIDQSDPNKTVQLDTVFLLAQNPDRSIVRLRNASKRLVAIIDQNFKEGKIQPGTPLQITYLGEKKNKTNSFKSNTWSVKPIAANNG